MTDQEYLNALIKTLPIHEREIAQLGNVFDMLDAKQDVTALQSVRGFADAAKSALFNADDPLEAHERLFHMVVLFVTIKLIRIIFEITSEND